MKKTYLRNKDKYPEFESNPGIEKIFKGKILTKRTSIKKYYLGKDTPVEYNDENTLPEPILGYITAQKKLADRRVFYKVFKAGIKRMEEMTTSELKVFFYICEKLIPDKAYFYFSMRECLNRTGYTKDYVITDAITGLLDKQVIFRSLDSFKFWINPFVVFNGDVTEAVKEFVIEMGDSSLKAWATGVCKDIKQEINTVPLEEEVESEEDNDSIEEYDNWF